MLEHRQIEFVGIDRTDEDQHGAMQIRPVKGCRRLGLKGLPEMVGIRHVAETVAAGIERPQRLLQLRRRCEQGIDSTTQIPLCRFQGRHGHPRLCLNPIHTVVDGSMKLS